MPTCQACKCTNTTGRTTKGKSFLKIREPKIATERERAQQWLHNMVWDSTRKHLDLAEFRFYMKTIFIKIVQKGI